MYSSSTQKMAWTFPDQEEISRLRTEANGKYRSRYLPFLENGDQQNDFLTAAEELLLCRIVTETGIRYTIHLVNLLNNQTMYQLNKK